MATKKSTSPLFVSGKDAIVKIIGSIGRASAKLTKDIQLAAVSCVFHALEHGDVTLADSLVDAAGKGLRRDSLRAWFEKNGAMVVSTQTKKFVLDKAKRDTLKAIDKAELAETLTSLPWDDAKREAPVVSVVDVSEAFDKFMQRLTKLSKEGEVTLKHRDLMDKLNTLQAIYHNEQVMSQRIHVPDTVEDDAPKA